ncbi:MAG TPA: hypothetical protein V6D00_12630 [Pantanalinema sp.]
MKKLALVALALSSLTACGLPTPGSSVSPRSVSTTVRRQAGETFDGLIGLNMTADPTVNVEVLSVGVTLGKKSFAASTVKAIAPGGASIVSDLYLGQDGGIYLAENNAPLGANARCYQVGTFKRKPQAKVLDAIDFQLDAGSHFEVKWKGLNPFGKNELFLALASAPQPVVTPVRLIPAEI